MEAKDYYKTFKAKDQVNDLNLKLIELVKTYNPASVLEFGCGTGKNLALLDNMLKIGIDISAHNVKVAREKLPLVICGDETDLKRLHNIDVCFTCSVLDHIHHAYPVVLELKRIANKAVIIAETNDRVGQFYFPHAYEIWGFDRVENYSFQGRFGANYHLYFLNK